MHQITARGTSGSMTVDPRRATSRPGRTAFRGASGASATLRWGYHQAASLRRWRVQCDPRGQWSLVAQVFSIDPYKSSKRPLFFVAQLKGGKAWQWEVTEFRVVNHVLHARLRAQEHTECEVASSAPRPSNSPCLVTTG